MKKIVIECNRKVRDYTIRQLKELTGLSVSEAYELMKENICLPIAESTIIIKRGQKLLKMIDRFKFPASIPVFPIDERHMRQFRERWTRYLQEQLNKIVGSSKPVYLVEEVNKMLKRRKSKITCTRQHLIWYLNKYGDKNMTPEAIATIITKFRTFDWNNIKPLVNNSKYTISLSKDQSEINPEEFKDKVEFIWSVPKPRIQDDMLAKLDNDIKVLEDFRKENELPAITTYDYENVFKKYVSRLQTLPPSKKRVSLKKDCPQKGNDDEQLTPDAQLALVRKQECPLCGQQLIQKISNTTGKHYLAHENGNACHYIAWGTFNSPSIHEKYNMNISRNGIVKAGT